MRGKLWQVMGVMAALMLLAVPALSASAQSTGQTYTLNPGQTVEWDLAYNGGDNPAMITVSGMPQGSLGFNVFTNQQWISANTATPIGMGTVWSKLDTSTNESVVQNNGALMWETGQSAPDTYHIQIYSRSNQPVQYTLTATGAGVAGIAPYAPRQQMNNIQLAAAQTAQTSPASTQSRPALTQTRATNPGLLAPRTLPVTGGSADWALFLGLGAALVALGWQLGRRRSY